MACSLFRRLGIEGHPHAQAHGTVLRPHGQNVILPLRTVRDALGDSGHDPRRLGSCGVDIGQLEPLAIADEVGAVVEIDVEAGHRRAEVTGWTPTMRLRCFYVVTGFLYSARD